MMCHAHPSNHHPKSLISPYESHKPGTVFRPVQATLREMLTRRMNNELKELKNIAMYKGALGEFMGSFFLISMCVGAALRDPAGPGVTPVEEAVGAGFFITTIVTALMTVSGSHFNPSVTFGFLVIGECTFVRFIFYVVFQVAGTTAGTAFLKVSSPFAKQNNLGVVRPREGVTQAQALTAEFTITFYLLFVVIAAIDKGRKDVHGSLAIVFGFAVSVNIAYAHEISGSAMNPARATGPAIVAGIYEDLWIYWVGPMLGAATACLLYEYVFSVKNMHRWCPLSLSYELVSPDESAPPNQDPNLTEPSSERPSQSHPTLPKQDVTSRTSEHSGL